jgi:pimeloyl-ACP methyl ester carboxylesterase
MSVEQAAWLSGRFRSRDGLMLHYRDYPGRVASDPAVICLPGLLRNARDFEELAPHLAQRSRVLCPDFRGRGASDYAPDSMSYVPNSYVRDLDALFDALELREATLIGTSLGGLVATVFSALRPERVSGIVLNDVGPDVDPAGLARIARYVGKAPPVATWQDAARATAMLDQAIYPGFGEEEWLCLARRRYIEDADGRVRLDHDPAIAQAFALPATTPDTWPFFAQLRWIPMLVLRGALSDILASAAVQRMQGVVPEMRAVEVPGRGHVPLLNEPVALAAIDDFLSSLPRLMNDAVRAQRTRAGCSFREAMAQAGNPLARLDH